MPTTITASNGTVLHLFQYPDSFRLEPTEEIAFNTLENDLSNGYHSQALFGSNTGLRTFTLKLNTMPHSTVMANTLTGINGDLLSRESYIWELYCESMVSGTPFVYQSLRNGQYYLVRFTDPKLSYQRLAVKIYSTGLTMEQVRISGVTVFDVSQMSSYSFGSSGNEWYKESSQVDPAWRQVGNEALANTPELDGTNCTFAANPQNGHNVVRLTAGSLSYLAHLKSGSGSSTTFYDMFLVMKVREATFTGVAGVVTNNTGGIEYLNGDAGQTKFANLSLSNFTYRYNGTVYAQSAMAAPMNTWGIVHLRFTSPVTLAAMRIGRSSAGVYLTADIGEIRTTSSLMPMNEVREFVEYLGVKWSVAL